MRRWMATAVVSVLITFFTFTNTPMGVSLPWMLILRILFFFLPASLVQMVWLWQHVRFAWLWPLTSLAGSLMFTIPILDSRSSSAFLVASLLYGFVQGIIMCYLWTQPRETEKAKREMAVDADAESAYPSRLAHLQEAEDTSIGKISPDSDKAEAYSRP